MPPRSGSYNADISDSEDHLSLGERVKFEIRGTSQYLQHAEFNNPSVSITAHLWQISSTADPRFIQIAARFRSKQQFAAL